LPEPESSHGCFSKHADQMTASEIIQIAKAFTQLGVRKIRITGGEPLVRKDAGDILQELGKLPVKLVMTTNGSRIHDFLDPVKKSGIKSINVSLDSLKEDTFRLLTGRNEFKQVKSNIELLLRENFHVKVNVVVMKGYNDNEVCDFVSWTQHAPIHVRFIEFMPFAGNHWNPEKVLTYAEILEKIQAVFPDMVKLEDHPHDTTKKYQVKNYKGTFAVISTMSEPFCSGCNRLRITADGKLRNCLFAKNEMDLLTPLREGKNIEMLIRENLSGKHFQLGGNSGPGWGTTETESSHRSMMGIGG
jgi:GTP 3',8-cyclase